MTNENIFFRDFTINSRDVNEKSRTVKLAFSSELPYPRYYGLEVLSHDSKAIRLDRIRNRGPLLLDHETQHHIGVVESVDIGSDRVGRATVRFSKNTEADAIFQDVLDGIRSHVSVGYIVHRAETSEENGQEIFRVIDWEPIEISIVAIPADPTVGVGRSFGIGSKSNSGVNFMQTETHSNVSVGDNLSRSQRRAEGRQSNTERERVVELSEIADAYANFGAREIVGDFIRSGRSVEDFKRTLVERMSNAPTNTAHDPFGEDRWSIGLNGNEASRFSFVRAIRAQVDPAWGVKHAGFELECSDTLAKKIGRNAQGLFVPREALAIQRRDLNVGISAQGGFLKGVEHQSQNFIQLLRNRALIIQLGATVLSGLQKDVAVPKQTGAATAYWVAEGAAPTESQPTFGQVSISPKSVAAWVDITRKLTLQSDPSIEFLVQSDLSSVLAIAIDAAAINGSGTGNEPRGILNTAGIGSVSIGANGGIPTWDHVVDLEGEVSSANADFGALGYLTNSSVRKRMKRTTKVSADAGAGFIWEGGQDGFGFVNGYKAGVSNNVPGNLTKGSGTNLSAMIFGNWADLIIGEWGGLDLLVDPYSLSTTGGVRVTAFMDCDIAVRNVGSFASIADAVTI